MNNDGFAIIQYYKTNGQDINFAFIRPNNYLPLYFDVEDVRRIFAAGNRNIKHNAMLQTLFYACLRASAICNLEDQDLDLKNLAIRVRNGKSGRDGLILITPECAEILKKYLKICPKMTINGKHPLFYTDSGRLWDRRNVYRIGLLPIDVTELQSNRREVTGIRYILFWKVKWSLCLPMPIRLRYSRQEDRYARFRMDC